MKKLIIAFGVVAMGVFATGCKKEYTCTCTVNGVTQDFPYEKQKKGDAEDACDAQESTYKIADPQASCSL